MNGAWTLTSGKSLL